MDISLVVNNLIGLLPGITALLFLVTIHEWGHWYFLRRYGVFVDRFSVGFGKAMWSREDRHGTRWMVAPVFLGGYVSFPYKKEDIPERMAGKVQDDQVFNNKRPSQRAMVMLGGPLINILFAFLIIPIAGMVQGIPSPRIQISMADCSLQKDDRLVALDGVSLSENWPFVAAQSLTVVRDGKQRDVVLAQKMPLYVADVRFVRTQAGWVSLLIHGCRMLKAECSRMAQTLCVLFSGDISRLRGLPTIIKAAQSRWGKGGANFLLFLGMLSLTLGVLNLLPFPGLDGGHLLTLGLSVLFTKGKPLPERVEKVIIYASMGLLLGFIAFINIRDILGLEIVQRLLS